MQISLNGEVAVLPQQRSTLLRQNRYFTIEKVIYTLVHNPDSPADGLDQPLSHKGRMLWLWHARRPCAPGRAWWRNRPSGPVSPGCFDGRGQGTAQLSHVPMGMLVC